MKNNINCHWWNIDRLYAKILNIDHICFFWSFFFSNLNFETVYLWFTLGKNTILFSFWRQVTSINLQIESNGISTLLKSSWKSNELKFRQILPKVESKLTRSYLQYWIRISMAKCEKCLPQLQRLKLSSYITFSARETNQNFSSQKDYFSISK